jgi:hypothetical protein
MSPAPGLITRREGLLALALLAPAGLVAACTGSSPAAGSSPTGSVAADGTAPAALASDVAAQEAALVAQYESVLAAVGTADAEATAMLSAIRDEHAAHRDALGGSDASPPAPSSPSDLPTAVAALVAAERDAARARIRSCVDAADAELARLLALIGASEASHVPALRDLRP